MGHNLRLPGPTAVAPRSSRLSCSTALHKHREHRALTPEISAACCLHFHSSSLPGSQRHQHHLILSLLKMQTIRLRAIPVLQKCLPGHLARPVPFSLAAAHEAPLTAHSRHSLCYEMPSAPVSWSSSLTYSWSPADTTLVRTCLNHLSCTAGKVVWKRV